MNYISVNATCQSGRNKINRQIPQSFFRPGIENHGFITAALGRADRPDFPPNQDFACFHSRPSIRDFKIIDLCFSRNKRFDLLRKRRFKGFTSEDLPWFKYIPPLLSRPIYAMRRWMPDIFRRISIMPRRRNARFRRLYFNSPNCAYSMTPLFPFSDSIKSDIFGGIPASICARARRISAAWISKPFHLRSRLGIFPIASLFLQRAPFFCTSAQTLCVTCNSISSAPGY